ncbi:MAG: ribbon-helix-helix protein, CopG family [Clostridia bacterium]|nr:ribbon-helix-helix protein, CopG family [Clostridia bacterium]
MKKNMYSLMLTEEVVREVDKLAARQGTNRSNLVNQILAEYVSFITPEKRTGDIFAFVKEGLSGYGDYDFVLAPHDMTMSVKSALSVKYRPTVKYDVQLFRSDEECMGELRVIFRTQSVELLRSLSRFFVAFVEMERKYLRRYFPWNESSYRLDDSRFVRRFRAPKSGSGNEGRAIVAYIRMFDDELKGVLSGRYVSVEDMESRYLVYLNGDTDII